MGCLGLYIHVPFCRARCGYCDFYSVTEAAPATVQRLVDALLAELAARRPPTPLGPTTVFVGGGTPTLLPEPDLARLLQAARVGVGPPGEFTIEANPESVGPATCEVLVGCGVNRLSLGAQSFVEPELRFLERIHDVPAIESAVRRARGAGIRNLNLDLIFGIPGQTAESWRHSLERAMDLGADHLACYGLTFEPGTRLGRAAESGRTARCEEGLEADLYLQAVDTLAEAGFEQYEISNFARPGCVCQHNLIYWRNDPFMGIGPSAAGYLDGRRYRNVADLEEYVERIERTGLAEEASETLTGAALAGEMVMLGLRMRDGLDTGRVRARTGVDIRTACAEVLADLERRSLLQCEGHCVRLGREGFLVADGIITDLMAALDRSY
jgi:oxygen-independent coproporphyrinogen-3 oxidase